MNTKPIIGIAPNYSYEKKEYTLSEDYVLAIEKAGGCPIVLLPHQALPPFLDGLLLTGGGDIDPLLFGEEPLCQSGEINPLRDACEMRICEAALEKDLCSLVTPLTFFFSPQYTEDALFLQRKDGKIGFDLQSVYSLWYNSYAR